MTNKQRLLDLSYRYKLSHIGSCLTALPIIEEIYELKKPGDIFVLSCGHAHLAHLVVMESKGLLNAEENLKYGIHCDRQAGCDVSTGSLGLGITVAVGMALADKSKDVYCLVSDGEMAEGSVFEALEIAHRLNLDNLKLYFNFNGYSAYDKTDTIRLKQKLSAYNLNRKIYETEIQYNFLQGLTGHYHILTKEEYESIS